MPLRLRRLALRRPRGAGDRRMRSVPRARPHPSAAAGKPRASPAIAPRRARSRGPGAAIGPGAEVAPVRDQRRVERVAVALHGVGGGENARRARPPPRHRCRFPPARRITGWNSSANICSISTSRMNFSVEAVRLPPATRPRAARSGSRRAAHPTDSSVTRRRPGRPARWRRWRSSSARERRCGAPADQR